MKNWVRGLSVVGLLAASSAHAAFVYSDYLPPYASPAYSVPSINDFQAPLAANGVSTFTLGRSLSLTGASAADTIEIDFFAAEAGYRNQFSWGSTLLINNQGNRAWAERDVATVGAYNGILDFSFNSPGVGTLHNFFNDTTRLGSFQSIGMALTDGGNTAWLLWDDSGANMDDNHDDLIVRLTYRSVPEPGTLALLGLGLVGAGLARRKKQVA